MKHDSERSISRRQFGGVVLSGLVAGKGTINGLLAGSAHRNS